MDRDRKASSTNGASAPLRAADASHVRSDTSTAVPGKTYERENTTQTDAAELHKPRHLVHALDCAATI